MRGRNVRALAVAVGVGALAGLLIGGGGSRLAMRLIALADDGEDEGRITSAEAVVGEVTLGGTLAVLRSGMILGVVGGLLYLGIRRWLHADPVRRTLTFACAITGIGLLITVEGNAEDFTFLDLGLSLGLFSATLLLFGLAVPPAVDRFSPPPERHRAAPLVTPVVVLVGLVAGVGAIARGVELAG